MDPLDPHKDPDDMCESGHGSFHPGSGWSWPWESQAGWITLQDLKDATDQGKKSST